MAVAPTTLTLEQFLALPEDEPALEFADGTVIQKVSPQLHHSALQSELLKRLLAVASRQQVGIFPELRVTFAGASRVPDIAIIRRERIPVDPSGRLANDFPEAPDVTIEIASPGQSINFLVRKCLWYVAHGVEIALLVDPADESVLVFSPERRVTAVKGAEHIDLGEMLPDFRLTAEELFASLRPR